MTAEIDQEHQEFLEDYRKHLKPGRDWEHAKVIAEQLWEGTQFTREMDAWKKERDDQRWMYDHPHAVWDFIQASKAMQQATDRFLQVETPAHPTPEQLKAIRLAKRRINRLIKDLEEYMALLETVK